MLDRKPIVIEVLLQKKSLLILLLQFLAVQLLVTIMKLLEIFKSIITLLIYQMVSSRLKILLSHMVLFLWMRKYGFSGLKTMEFHMNIFVLKDIFGLVNIQNLNELLSMEIISLWNLTKLL